MSTTTGSADLPDAAHTGPGPAMSVPVVAQAPGFHGPGNPPPAQSSYNPVSFIVIVQLCVVYNAAV